MLSKLADYYVSEVFRSMFDIEEKFVPKTQNFITF